MKMKWILPIMIGLSLIAISACNNDSTAQKTTLLTVANAGAEKSEPTLTPTATPTVAPIVTVTPTVAPTVKETTAATPTPAETTSAATTAKETTAATTAKPTPKPTVKETTAATTAVPTQTAPPATTAATPAYAENPDNIRSIIVQYCIDNGLWMPDGEICGDGSKGWSLGYNGTDDAYAQSFINGKIRGNVGIKSVSCWIDSGYIYISYEKTPLPTS